MLSGEGLITDCGAAHTRVISVPALHIGSFGTGIGSGPDGYKGVVVTNGGQSRAVTINRTGGAADYVETYNLAGDYYPEALEKEKTITATVIWVGPFLTAPEAQASPCPTVPVAVSDTFIIDLLDPLTAERGFGISPDSANPIPVTAPGVYRLMVTQPATDYTAAIEPVCETSLLVTVK
jgi:hypothetical protein